MDNGLYDVGKVEYVRLGFDPDLRCFRAIISFDFGGSGQGIVMILSQKNCYSFLTGVVQVAGVSWEKLEGTYLAIVRDEPYGTITELRSEDGSRVFRW